MKKFEKEVLYLLEQISDGISAIYDEVSNISLAVEKSVDVPDHIKSLKDDLEYISVELTDIRNSIVK